MIDISVIGSTDTHCSYVVGLLIVYPQFGLLHVFNLVPIGTSKVNLHDCSCKNQQKTECEIISDPKDTWPFKFLSDFEKMVY